MHADGRVATVVEGVLDLLQEPPPCCVGVLREGVFGQLVHVVHRAVGLPGEHLQGFLAAHPRRRGQLCRVVAGEFAVQGEGVGRAARGDRAVRVGAFPYFAGLRLAVPHDDHRVRASGAFPDAVHEDRQQVLVGGMGQDAPRLAYRHPADAVDLADVGAVHGAEGVDQVFGVHGLDRTRHPEHDVLGVDGAVLGPPGFLALLGQRVFDLAEVWAELHGGAGFLAEFADRGVAMRLVGIEFALRPAPVVVFGTVDDADLEVVEVMFRGIGCVRRRFAPTVENAARRFHDSSDFVSHSSHCRSLPGCGYVVFLRNDDGRPRGAGHRAVCGIRRQLLPRGRR